MNVEGARSLLESTLLGREPNAGRLPAAVADAFGGAGLLQM
jgi:hypothetical protein